MEKKVQNNLERERNGLKKQKKVISDKCKVLIYETEMKCIDIECKEEYY